MLRFVPPPPFKNSTVPVRRQKQMNSNTRRQFPNRPKLRIDRLAGSRGLGETTPPCRPMEPGYYLLRLRLQYAHKGTRRLARIL